MSIEEWVWFLIGVCGLGLFYLIEKLDTELSAKKRNYLWLEAELYKERNKSAILSKRLEKNQERFEEIKQILEQSE